MQKLLNPMRHELLTEELLEIFSRSLSSHPTSMFHLCSSHAGPTWDTCKAVFSHPPQGDAHGALLLVPSSGHIGLWSSHYTHGRWPHTHHPSQGPGNFQTLQISFPVVLPSHGLPFPVVESLSSSPPCLGGTTLLYILYPFYTVLLEMKLSSPTSKCCLWYIKKASEGKTNKKSRLSVKAKILYYFTMGFLFLINFYLNTEHFHQLKISKIFKKHWTMASLWQPISTLPPKQSLPINNMSTLH